MKQPTSNRPPMGSRSILSLLAVVASMAISLPAAPPPVLFEWERGVGLRYPGQPAADMYLWFYEWNMFEAMAEGQHTHGTYQLDRKVNPAGTEAVIESPALRLTVRAVPDGAELLLRVTNRTTHAWPEIAGIIPCWNPGQVSRTDPNNPVPANRNFSDPGHNKTFFLTTTGLVPLTSRAIHFNANYRTDVDRASDHGKFVFSPKWPTSDVNSSAGVLIRESEDGRWVTGIGWEDTLSVQGHNPWSCMHACIRVGALKPNESKTVRGKLYLFPGARKDCLAQFQKDFPERPAPR